MILHWIEVCFQFFLVSFCGRSSRCTASKSVYLLFHTHYFATPRASAVWSVRGTWDPDIVSEYHWLVQQKRVTPNTTFYSYCLKHGQSFLDPCCVCSTLICQHSVKLDSEIWAVCVCCDFSARGDYWHFLPS